MSAQESIWIRIRDYWARIFFRQLKKIPVVRRQMDKEYAEIMQQLESSLKPYRGEVPSYTALPSTGLEREQILEEMDQLQQREQDGWQSGRASGAVYHGDQEHIDFLNKVYSLHSQSNPLHADLWPSANKYEAEIVAMASSMLHGERAQDTGDETCGVVTSGGTESILLAMKTYRDMGYDQKGITKPEIVLPISAHAAFDKAAEYFGISLRKTRLDDFYRADVKDAKSKISKNTVALVGSAPSFPHGIMDPIAEMSYLAKDQGIPFHTDACLGGFLLPWLEKLGYTIPLFDFRMPGVSSISVDTHKYGFAAKGTSVLLYRNKEIRHYQFFKTTDWPGGLYFSPTFAGSRPGALSATAWAAMLSMGEEGYREAARKIMDAASVVRQGVEAISELKILGDPLWNIAFSSQELNIYRIMEKMTEKGWSLNGLHKPEAVHICLTLRHTQEGLAESFVQDLRDAVEFVKANPKDKGDMAPVYGMAATMPDREAVAELLDLYMDALYKV